MLVEFETGFIGDVSNIKADATGRSAKASCVPHVQPGLRKVFCGYVTGTGDGGAKARARLMFNQVTGKFGLEDMAEPNTQTLFDRSLDEIEAARIQANSVKRASRRRGDLADGPESADDPESEDNLYTDAAQCIQTDGPDSESRDPDQEGDTE